MHVAHGLDCTSNMLLFTINQFGVFFGASVKHPLCGCRLFPLADQLPGAASFITVSIERRDFPASHVIAT
jgi:hypothetical protein